MTGILVQLRLNADTPYTTIRPFLVFCARFRSALFAPKGLRIIAQGCREAATLGKHNPTAQPQRGCVRECRYIK
ncbi:MAG: hypothetical protein BECKG1743F_GA0114225_100604, partial [Candidatus Kentron sp. G]